MCGERDAAPSRRDYRHIYEVVKIFKVHGVRLTVVERTEGRRSCSDRLSTADTGKDQYEGAGYKGFHGCPNVIGKLEFPRPELTMTDEIWIVLQGVPFTDSFTENGYCS